MGGAPEDGYRARVVLLGASNLTRGFPRVVAGARRRLGAPLDVRAALGHGRSYGTVSSFLGRTLPGIGACGLWRGLESSGPPTHALLCDLGNDLAYGARPDQVLAWVRACLDRLGGARATVVGLPLPSLRRLAPWQFRLWASIFFPGRGLVMERILDGAAELEAGLAALAAERGLAHVPARGEWFAADPIHYARRSAAEAWSAVLAPWGANAEPAGDGAPVPRPPPPAWSRVLGLERTRAQPAARLGDGTALSMY